MTDRQQEFDTDSEVIENRQRLRYNGMKLSEVEREIKSFYDAFEVYGLSGSADIGDVARAICSDKGLVTRIDDLIAQKLKCGGVNISCLAEVRAGLDALYNSVFDMTGSGDIEEIRHMEKDYEDMQFCTGLMNMTPEERVGAILTRYGAIPPALISDEALSA